MREDQKAEQVEALLEGKRCLNCLYWRIDSIPRALIGVGVVIGVGVEPQPSWGRCGAPMENTMGGRATRRVRWNEACGYHLAKHQW